MKKSLMALFLSVCTMHTVAAETKVVLSIDGGGVRGVIPARILQELEERTGLPTHEMFDVIAGTSAGGLIALGLSAPGQGPGSVLFSPKDLVDFFKNQSHLIFRTCDLMSFMELFNKLQGGLNLLFCQQ